jgi:glycerophosphoryl diester phosphodiesterase
MSLDKVPVIIHDPTLNRTTKLSGDVSEASAATMRQAGVPTLDELTSLTRGRIVLVIEIKGGESVEEAVVENVRSKCMDDQVIIFSFDQGHVRRTKKLNAALFAVLLVGSSFAGSTVDALFDAMAEANAEALGFWYPVVTPEIVAEARKRGVPVFAWTVPPGAEVDRLVELKVNFIITNHPREVLVQVNG